MVNEWPNKYDMQDMSTPPPPRQIPSWQISTMRKQVLLELFSASRVGRLRLHAWAGREAGDVLTAPEMFQTTMDAVWGEGGFASERAQLWDNWDLMLFWLDILQVSVIHDLRGREQDKMLRVPVGRFFFFQSVQMGCVARVGVAT